MKSSLLVLFFFAIGGSVCAQEAPQGPGVLDPPRPVTAEFEEGQKSPDIEKATEIKKLPANKSLAEIQKAQKNFKLQLKRRINKDQKTRKAIISYRQRSKTIDPERIKKLYKKASDVDGDNLKWLQSHIDEYGWPAISAIGRQSANEFFILVLHADRDSEFQRKCLDLMSKMPDGEWSKGSYKQLEFRISMLEGKYEDLPLPTTPLPK